MRATGLGIKPLYYRVTPESFLFGSEIKVLLAYGVQPEFHAAALSEYLAFGYLSGEETFYEGVRKLMPGHWMEVKSTGTSKLSSIGTWTFQAPARYAMKPITCRPIGRCWSSAVESHLMSDVPLGVFLSGGVDSSAVAALMTKIRQVADRDVFRRLRRTNIQRTALRSHGRAASESHPSRSLVSENEFFDSLRRTDLA